VALQLHPRGQQHAQHAEQVGGVEAAQQPAADRARSPRRFDLQAQAALGEIEPVARDLALAQPVPEHVDARAVERGRQLAPEGVVQIDHGVLEARPMEQLRLGRAVAAHAAVVIQVISRKIGEQRGGERHAVHPAQVEPMGGDFHRDAPGAAREQVCHFFLQRDRVGCGVSGGCKRAGKADPQRADDCRGTTQIAQ
jgi:hypothetical protein